MKYQEFFYNATVQSIAFCLDVINAGRATRRWFETDEVIAPLLILFAQVVFLAVALTAKHTVFGAIAAYRWVRERGVTETLAVADITCRLLLCYDEPVGSVAEGGDPGFVLPEPEVLSWAKQRWPQLAA